MPSKISYQDYKENKSRLISYCLESPVEVIRKVLPTHRIFQYGNISLPVDSEMDLKGNLEPNYGLIIKQAISPPGTQIVQNLSGIDLRVAEAEIRHKRDPNDMRRAFKKTIAESMSRLLDSFGTTGCYLDFYEIAQEEGSQHPIYEKKVKQLLEIAEVAFSIQNPTVNDLRKILK